MTRERTLRPTHPKTRQRTHTYCTVQPREHTHTRNTHTRPNLNLTQTNNHSKRPSNDAIANPTTHAPKTRPGTTTPTCPEAHVRTPRRRRRRHRVSGGESPRTRPSIDGDGGAPTRFKSRSIPGSTPGVGSRSTGGGSKIRNRALAELPMSVERVSRAYI